MVNLKAWITLCGTGIFLAGCEGRLCGDGTIYDAETNIPLDSVKCEVLTDCEPNENVNRYSDSAGSYNVCNCLSGCIPKCPDIRIEYSRPGYKAKILVNPGGDPVYLEKE